MKIANWIAAVTVATVGYAAAGPFITINHIKDGVEARDANKLEKHIDFPVLRENVKLQLQSYLSKEKAVDEESLLGSLARGFMSQMADGMVESFVTPTGLAGLMEGQRPDQQPSKETPSSGGAVSANSGDDEKTLFKNARYTYDSLRKFSAWVKDEQGDEIRFVLTREGLSWKLSNITL